LDDVYWRAPNDVMNICLYSLVSSCLVNIAFLDALWNSFNSKMHPFKVQVILESIQGAKLSSLKVEKKCLVFSMVKVINNMVEWFNF